MRAGVLARIAAAVTGVAVGLAALAFSPARAGAAQAAVPATGYRTAGALSGLAAVSAGNAWAVGYAGSESARKVLLVHWNGRSWTRVTSPKILNGTVGALSAVTVVSADDAWAVGTVGGGLGHALILHWNGKAWSQATGVPAIGGALYGVTATATGAWAVGVNLGQTVVAPLLLHWNGKAWSRASIKLDPASQSESILTGVAVTAAKTAWAVGYTSQGIPNSMLVRWNGKTWSTGTSFPVSGIQRSLEGVATGPRGTAFAVGNGETRPLRRPGDLNSAERAVEREDLAEDHGQRAQELRTDLGHVRPRRHRLGDRLSLHVGQRHQRAHCALERQNLGQRESTRRELRSGRARVRGGRQRLGGRRPGRGHPDSPLERPFVELTAGCPAAEPIRR